jgi:hypothetical protein
VNCTYVWAPNGTTLAYMLPEGGACFGMVSDPNSVNETYLHACDLDRCCVHELEPEPEPESKPEPQSKPEPDLP